MARRVLVLSLDPSRVPQLLPLLERDGLTVTRRRIAEPTELVTVVVEDGPDPDLDAGFAAAVVFDSLRAPSPPLVSIDFAPDDDVVPCSHCVAWRHELAVDEAGEKVLREWHLETCPTWLAWE